MSATGGCLCGAVRYRVDGALGEVVLCHCVQCRRTSGHYAAGTFCAREALTVDGEVRWYRSTGWGERGFCPTCGSQMFYRRIDSNEVSVGAGTLDAPTGLRATSQIFLHEKADYYDAPDLPEGRWP